MEIETKKMNKKNEIKHRGKVKFKNFRPYPNEIFKEISLGEDDFHLQMFYAISNFGRFISYQDNIENGRLLKCRRQDGYVVWAYCVRDEKNKRRYKRRFLYKLVAEYFLHKPSAEHKYVLHLNYNRSHDHVDNLKWATYEEMKAHRYYSPSAIKSREKSLLKLWEAKGGRTLTDTQVRILKKKLLNPNRKTRMKILARQFGVTEMQLHRIKTGENWGEVKV